MKRTPLRRKTHLKRTPMRRRKHSTKYARRERDIPRMLWIKSQPCAANDLIAPAMWLGPVTGCWGPIEAHHAGRHGYGEKPPDDTVIPLCDHHHNLITGEPGGRGCFDGWPRGTVKLWELAVVEHYQRLYAQTMRDDTQIW